MTPLPTGGESESGHRCLKDLSDEELKREHSFTRMAVRKKKQKPTAKIQSLDTIEREDIDWVWLNRIALGKLTVFAGDPGVGKSQASLDVVARLSTGRLFPDGTPGTMGDCLILTCEDDPGDTIRPRLEAVGADLSRVHYIHGKLDSKGSKSFLSLLDVDVILDAIDQVRSNGGTVKLLVIDPLDGFLDDTDSHKAADVRQSLMPILDLAKAERFAIVGIMHLNKGMGNAAYKVNGSIAFTALPRFVFMFVKDPNQEGRRVFLCVKSNLGKDTGGLQYTIADTGDGSSCIRWEGQADDDINDLLKASQAPKPSPDRDAPRQRELLALFEARHPEPVQRDELARLLGISPSATSNLLAKLRSKAFIEPNIRFGFWQLSSPSPSRITDDTSDGSDPAMQSSPSLRSPVILSGTNDDSVRIYSLDASSERTESSAIRPECELTSYLVDQDTGELNIF